MRSDTMNVLIVDDDRFVVASLEQKVNWPSLGIQHVYTAYNIRQAKKILTKETIDLMISDIEMPHGSGLELLAWIRSEGYTVQTIFLTNFADFHYAQKAIELQSFEYYLKPIEMDKLELIIMKAIKKIKVHQSSEKALKVGEYWEKNKQKLIDHFWATYIRNKAFLHDEQLKEKLQIYHLNYSIHDSFLPILLDVFPYTYKEKAEITFQLETESYSLATFQALINTLFNDTSLSLESLIEIDTNKEKFLLLLKTNDALNTKEIVASCQEGMQLLRSNLSIDSQFSIGHPVALTELHKATRELQQKSDDTIDFRNKVFLFPSYEIKDYKYMEPNLLLLEESLQNSNKQRFLTKCKNYLEQQAEKKTLNLEILNSFQLDITQIIFTHLKKQEILAHKLFHNKTSHLLQSQSLRSIDDMISYITFLVDVSLDYIDFIHSQKSVVNIICDYIDENYQENITRESIAKVVYLSPDYIARIFKKEKGISLVHYIMKKRVHTAKELLIQTNLPVHTISDKVGYGNYSYFTKLFKKETGFTPCEYRREAGASGLQASESREQIPHHMLP